MIQEDIHSSGQHAGSKKVRVAYDYLISGKRKKKTYVCICVYAHLHIYTFTFKGENILESLISTCLQWLSLGAVTKADLNSFSFFTCL